MPQVASVRAERNPAVSVDQALRRNREQFAVVGSTSDRNVAELIGSRILTQVRRENGIDRALRPVKFPHHFDVRQGEAADGLITDRQQITVWSLLVCREQVFEPLKALTSSAGRLSRACAVETCVPCLVLGVDPQLSLLRESVFKLFFLRFQ